MILLIDFCRPCTEEGITNPMYKGFLRHFKWNVYLCLKDVLKKKLVWKLASVLTQLNIFSFPVLFIYDGLSEGCFCDFNCHSKAMLAIERVPLAASFLLFLSTNLSTFNAAVCKPVYIFTVFRIEFLSALVRYISVRHVLT